ncbi:MAG TPA: aspartate-semialdehyde dehydrogenase [Steroidobacteraceae bacterium]|jgi:aspartate-semialdehyde dehydrogenase|nr:aspartate-semialdehyde dehydrogenase [Steroidobacteraceae bacterium]
MSPATSHHPDLSHGPAVQSRAAFVVAVVGATGAVGVEMARCLEQRNFPVSELRLLASARSAGKTQRFRGQNLTIQELTESSFTGVQIALFSAGGGVSKRYAPIAARAGAIVIDNSSAFRMNDDVPLVVPEINAAQIAHHHGIIANPNCAAIISILPLWPIHQKNPIQRLQLATYQAASGAGAAAMEELREATRAHLEGREYRHTVLPHPYAFNVFSHNTRVDPGTGYNEEETKVMQEARKIFGEPNLRVSATCVRVPVLRAHCVALTFECRDPITPQQVRALLAGAPGVRIVDDVANNYFPMPKDASGQDDVLVGRIRQDLSDPSGHSIALFCAGDQLLKGAALNAVQIAEAWVPMHAAG